LLFAHLLLKAFNMAVRIHGYTDTWKMWSRSHDKVERYSQNNFTQHQRRCNSRRRRRRGRALWRHNNVVRDWRSVFYLFQYVSTCVCVCVCVCVCMLFLPKFLLYRDWLRVL